MFTVFKRSIFDGGTTKVKYKVLVKCVLVFIDGEYSVSRFFFLLKLHFNNERIVIDPEQLKV